MMTNNRGFTLIEIMVVLIIMSVFLSIVILGFDRVDSRRADSQAIELASWLKNIADMAIFDSAVYGVHIEDDTLQVYGFTGSKWRKSIDLEAYTIASSVSLTYESPNDSVFFETERGDEEGDDIIPEFALLPTGEVEPNGSFTMQAQSQPPIVISWDDVGAIQIGAEGG